MNRPARPPDDDAPRWRTLREGDVYRRLADMVDRGEDGVLATVISTRRSAPRHAGSKMIVHADGAVTGSIGGGAAEALVIERAADVAAGGECVTVPIDLTGQQGVCGGSMEVFLEPVLRAIPFVVVGAGHVGQAMVDVGHHLGFRFTLVDDRPEALAAITSPGVRPLLAAPAELAVKLTVPRRGAVLVCSRNHELDAGYLEALLRLELVSDRSFAFFGSLGSQTKAARLRGRIAEIPELRDAMARVRLPVGITIGAETPAEIALSVLAEAQAVLRGVPVIRAADGVRGYPLHGQF